MIPFFVADRPMSLNIIKTFFVDHPGVRFGLMSHALVSEAFRELYAKFPCDFSGCWLDSRKPTSWCECSNGAQDLRSAVIKAVDYGIFSKDKSLSYSQLFDIYERMGADLGIMKDVFADHKRTVESAKRAVENYCRKPRRFKLVLVAQGTTIDEYLWCMNKLLRLGVGEIAIGGLLKRKINSVRYASAARIADLDDVLNAVQRAHPGREFFVLGCYHPKRHRLFADRAVFGSDYKGWIFNYEHRIDRLNRLHIELSKFEKGCSGELAKLRRYRQNLARQVATARQGYATTKNDSAKNSIAKAAIRTQLSKLLKRIEVVDINLAQLRVSEKRRVEQGADYSKVLVAYQTTLSQTEQEIRVAGVHEYLRREVLPLITSKVIPSKLNCFHSVTNCAKSQCGPTSSERHPLLRCGCST
jgi:hypothetical protein